MEIPVIKCKNCRAKIIVQQYPDSKKSCSLGCKNIDETVSQKSDPD